MHFSAYDDSDDNDDGLMFVCLTANGYSRYDTVCNPDTGRCACVDGYKPEGLSCRKCRYLRLVFAIALLGACHRCSDKFYSQEKTVSVLKLAAVSESKSHL